MNHPIQSAGVVRAGYPSCAWKVTSGIMMMVKGDDSSVGEKNCSKINGKSRYGKCKDVCEGKEVTKDYAGRYGHPGDYYCRAAVGLGTVSLVSPVFRLLL